MNANMEFTTFAVNNVCRVCLKTASDLSLMSNEHINLYRNIVDETALQEFEIKVCAICEWMLGRFTKFKLQCWTANSMLSQTTYEDTRSIHFQQNLKISHHFVQTPTEKSQYIPRSTSLHDQTCYTVDIRYRNKSTVVYTNDKQSDDKNEIDDTFDVLDATENDQYMNDDDSNDKNSYEFKDTVPERFHFANKVNNKDTIDENDIKMKDANDSDIIASEDEIPLLFLRKNDEEIIKKTVKRDGKEKLHQKDMIMETLKEYKIDKEETDSKEKSKKNKKKKRYRYKSLTIDSNKYQEGIDKAEGTIHENGTQKKIKDGFSKRMVQETSEYEVIKRTKEQVLQEMSERAKTDVYINFPFKCEKCVKGFNFQEVLDKHLEKHSQKSGTFHCDICGQYCPSAVSLRGHMKFHTTRYKCKVCGCVKACRQHLLEHHAAHMSGGAAYCCDSCSFTTDKRTVMQRHARTHAGRVTHACDKCGKLCRSIGSLRLHIARHNKAARFKCPHCDKSFIYYSLVRKHIKCTHERRELYCVECDVYFTSPDSLRAHLKKAKKHRDPVENKHVCESCGKSFFTSSSLAAHMSSAHDAPKTHACPHCDKHYSSRDTVRAHIWRSHTRGDASATCHHCGSTFARKSTLAIHKRTHTGARAHVCACGTAFAHSTTAHTHAEAKHKMNTQE